MSTQAVAQGSVTTLDLIERLAAGETIEQLAARLYPDNIKSRRAFTRRAYRRVALSEVAQQEIAQIAQAMMMGAIPGVTQALIRRALRGRPDAIKLLFEASGFHNPKVDHRHSGDVKLTLVAMPRPQVGPAEHSAGAIEGTATEVVEGG